MCLQFTSEFSIPDNCEFHIQIRMVFHESLGPLKERIKAAFVFGSVAKRSDTASSDIDVLVLSDDIDYADVFGALHSAEAKLGRTVNPTVYTPANWRRKRKGRNAFVVKVSAQPRVFLIGTEEDLA